MAVLIYKQEEDGSVTKEIIPPELLEGQLAAGWTVENPDAEKVESVEDENTDDGSLLLSDLIEEARKEDIETIERLVADLSQAKTDISESQKLTETQRDLIANLETGLGVANQKISDLESAEAESKEAEKSEKK